MRLWHYAIAPQTMGNYLQRHLCIETFVLIGDVSLLVLISIDNSLKYLNASVPSKWQIFCFFFFVANNRWKLLTNWKLWWIIMILKAKGTNAKSHVRTETTKARRRIQWDFKESSDFTWKCNTWIHRFINSGKNGKSIEELHYLKSKEKYANVSYKILMRRKG